MRRKAVSRRLGAVAEVRASIHAHRGLVAAKLDERLPPSDGESTFGYQVYFDHMDGELEAVEQGLIASEDEHARKLAQIVQTRREKEELTDGLQDKQIAARQIVNGYFGEDRGFEVAAIKGRTPQDSKSLAEQVDQTTKFLRDPAGESSPGRIRGVSLDFEEMALDLETDLGSVESTSTEYIRLRKEADGTRQAVNAAIAGFDAVFPWVTSSLEGHFRLVGERELADRIRTSRRRVTRRQGEVGEGEESGESSSDEGSATESETSETAPQASES
jgi:hypothetical protein